MHLQLARHALVTDAAGAVHALGAIDGALLAWLALEGPTPRARLALLLWPGSRSEAAARNALRQRLFQLHRRVGAELVEGSGRLALAAGVRHDLDDADGVLADLAVEIGGEFAQWLEQQRQRRRLRMGAALVDLAERAERAGDWDDALVHAGELLALEPLSEDTHRRVMRLHYLRGDRAAALLAFDRCERALKDEVGARPSAVTLALLQTIESGRADAAPPHAGPVPAGVLRPPRLVGRERERAALAQGWRSAPLVALIGEAGLGKTRLLQDFAVAHPGAVLAAGRPGDAGVPFATLARLLRAVLARDARGVQALADTPARSELARVLPELDAAPPPYAGAGQRLVLQAALQAWLAERPGLEGLIVDDLHFADAASVETIGALVDPDDDAAGARRLCWMLAYRPAEAGTPVCALHDGLIERARLLPLRLEPLSEASLAELVDSLALPGVTGAALAAGLRQRTGGNPLFVLETLKQAWVEHRLAELADAQALPRPLSVERLIERRLAQLSPAALALARLASIAGVDFSIALAEQVLGARAMQFADALNELEAAQVLRGTQFAHDLVFEAVQAGVPAAIAQHTHAQVAGWLEQQGGEPARVAAHWSAAGAPARALPWLARAAERAGAALRRKEQIGFLDRQCDIEAASGARDAAFATLLRIVDLEVTLDDAPIPRGLARCDRLDTLAGDTPQRIAARLQRAHWLAMRGLAEDAEAVAAAALAEAQRGGVDEALVIDCRDRLAVALSVQDRAAEAMVQMQASLAWIDAHGGDARRCDLHGNLAMTFDTLGRLAEALPHHRLAIELAQRTGHHANLTQCVCNLAANRIVAGDLREGELLLERVRQLRSAADDSASVDGFVDLHQAICDYQSGRYRQALAALDEGEAHMARFAPGFANVLQNHRAVCWAHLGQWGRVRQLLAALGPFEQLRHTTHLRAAWLAWQADQALGGRADARPLAAALGRLARDDAPDMQHLAQLELALLAPPREGLAQLEEVLAQAERFGHDGTRIVAQARAARLAAALGDAAGARAHAREALELLERHQVVRQYPAEPWLHVAQALAALGDAAPARTVAAQGAAWVRQVAAENVPDEFRAGFLHRNPVNRELLALAARGGA